MGPGCPAVRDAGRKLYACSRDAASDGICSGISAGYPPFYDENPYGIYQKAGRSMSGSLRASRWRRNPTVSAKLVLILQVLKGHVDFPRHFDVKAKDPFGPTAWRCVDHFWDLLSCPAVAWQALLGQDLIQRLLQQDRSKRLGCLKPEPQVLWSCFVFRDRTFGR